MSSFNFFLNFCKDNNFYNYLQKVNTKVMFLMKFQNIVQISSKFVYVNNQWQEFLRQLPHKKSVLIYIHSEIAICQQNRSLNL